MVCGVQGGGAVAESGREVDGAARAAAAVGSVVVVVGGVAEGEFTAGGGSRVGMARLGKASGRAGPC